MSRRALIVGGSRGVGAATAAVLARAGWHPTITYRQHEARARRVIEALDGGAMLALDVTDPASRAATATRLRRDAARFDAVILCASGGLEPGAAPTHARAVNVAGQLAVLETVLPFARAAARIVYLTSHAAHFYGHAETHPHYAPIAASKREGETALRARAAAGLGDARTLTVISADLIADSSTAKLLALRDPAIVERCRAAAGRLPTSLDVAEAVLDVLAAPPPPAGDTVFVWEPSPLYTADRHVEAAS